MKNFIVPKESTYKEILLQVQEETIFTDPSSLDNILQLLKFTINFSSAVDKYFSHYSLSQGRFSIMILLFTHPKLTWTPAMLAEYIGITRASITGLLDGVEKSGFVERETCPQDRRQLIITLTQKGKTFIEEMLPEHSQRVSQFMSAISKEEQNELNRILGKISKKIPLLMSGI